MINLAILHKISRAAKYARKFQSFAVAILCISILVYLHGLFDYALEIPVVMLTFSWFLGIGLGITNRFVG